MSVGNKIEALKRLKLFAALELEALRLLAFAAPEVEFGSGEIVFKQGDHLKASYLVLSGAILLVNDRGGAAKNKMVGSGALIGSHGLIAEAVAANTAIAQENSATLKLSRDLFFRVLSEFPTSAAAMRKSLVQEIETFGAEVGRTQRILSTPKF
ncbi:cyclic nucleotide-binding domain-containing protein [Rhodoblastus acidophilus]|uniref:Cyclic nucleotide-binding domain-containing protein n=1 Tax=Candidatus Rhodoblastus alkanivorans TaxID=2954117 RepID=A0ABS9Z1Z8_9HYPH|nr:cyclic nucleotide-binding domain-containing protein [Candidatus Rhodoblastus alkanivorans]MCI4679945.1 cyclic nucleotide-binding domain-containing protein [Candidatus Rhodoblastus alkanivorans]MCI4681480.1 cyclic nucleotide-binding domain-containing protein [Candidatus Rhodoblastus alkanivorans]MDI4642528.1 cyclic nucleotide-binding domain-containing protein [Rhodoblastus acidophilus]